MYVLLNRIVIYKIITALNTSNQVIIFTKTDELKKLHNKRH